MRLRTQLIFVQLLLLIALAAVTHLATTDIDYQVVGGIDDQIGHLAAFYVLALLADFAFPRRGYGLRKVLPLLAYGLLIEIIQYYLPHRDFALLDLAADAAGLLLYGLSLPLLRRLPIIKRRFVFLDHRPF